MQEPDNDGPQGLLVDLVRAVLRVPRWIAERLRRDRPQEDQGARPRPRGSGNDATITICASAIILSIAGWTRPGLDAFVLDARGFADEPWRLLSTHFVHVNVIHLYFNLSWIWFLGREIEQRLGSAMLIGTSLFMMLGTSAVVQAFDRGGIGLSGVVYGMWAMLFVGQRRCELLRGILTARINQLMILWFFFCIVATMTGTFPVSNWGHGAGAVLGALVGLGITEDGRMRPASLPLGSVLLALLTCGATLWWPTWNFGGAAIELERRGDVAIERSDWTGAEAAYRKALDVDPKDGRAWWNLGCALSKLDRKQDSIAACYRAFECGDLDGKYVTTLKEQLRWLLESNELDGDERSGFEWAKRAVKVAPKDKRFWRDLIRLADKVGERDEGARARAALAELDKRG